MSAAQMHVGSAARVDLELIGVATAVLDCSSPAARLRGSTSAPAALADPEFVRELASEIDIVSMNTAAAIALQSLPDAPRSGKLTDLIGMSPEVIDTLRGEFAQIARGGLIAVSEMKDRGRRRIILVDWRASDTTYDHVVVTLRDVTAARSAAEQWAEVSAQMGRLGTATNRIARRLDAPDAKKELVDQVNFVLESDEAVLVMVDREEDVILDSLRIDESGRLKLAEPSWLEFSSGLGGHVYRTGETTSVNDLSKSELVTGPAHDRAIRRGPTAALATMLGASHEHAGVIVAFRAGDARPFSDADAAALELLAASAARAIENSGLYEWISEESAALAAAEAEIKSAYDQLATAQARLLQVQKLEAIGELASGIAHEINTPIQFIGDNAHFLTDAAPSLAAFHTAAVTLIEAARGVPELAEQTAAAADAAEAADLAFTDTESAEALAQIREGVQRVAEIVRAMKDFAHPGSSTKSPMDLNKAIENTVAIARNEWKYHADIALDLDEGLPAVPALAGPLKQALLILIVNAAQAIQDAVGDSGNKGTIAISTSQSGDSVLVKITDSGCGIPEEIQDRIFDPFFTTKEVGRGTGQGLTMCRNAITEQHGGSIEFETELGVGTTFTIALPLDLEDGA